MSRTPHPQVLWQVAEEPRWPMTDRARSPEGTGSLADYTDPALIIPCLQGPDEATVIRELCTVLQGDAGVTDLLPFYQAALNREFLLSTAMDFGLAFPHARVAGLARLRYALGRSGQPLAWGPRGGPPVRLVFLCAVPATEATAYLLLSSGLARLAGEPVVFARLLEASDVGGMLESLRQIPLRATRLEAR